MTEQQQGGMHPQLWAFLRMFEDDVAAGELPDYDVVTFLGGVFVKFEAQSDDRVLVIRTKPEAEVERFYRATGMVQDLCRVCEILDDAAELASIEAGLLGDDRAWTNVDWGGDEDGAIEYNPDFPALMFCANVRVTT